MERETVHVPGISEAIDRADVPLVAVTRANGFVFVSGMPPLDLEEGGFVVASVREQTRIALEHLQRCLEAAGSSMAGVCKARIYGPLEGYAEINEVYGSFFGDPPARTFVPTPDLPIPADIEIECTAVA